MCSTRFFQPRQLSARKKSAGIFIRNDKYETEKYFALESLSRGSSSRKNTFFIVDRHHAYRFANVLKTILINKVEKVKNNFAVMIKKSNEISQA